MGGVIVKRFLSIFLASFILFVFSSNLISVDAAEIADIKIDTGIPMTDAAIDYYDSYFTEDFDYSEINRVYKALQGSTESYGVIANYFSDTPIWFPVGFYRCTVEGHSGSYYVIMANINNNLTSIDYSSQLKIRGDIYVCVLVNYGYFWGSGGSPSFNHYSSYETFDYVLRYAYASNSNPFPVKTSQKKELKFTFSDNFANHMQLDNYNDTFTINVSNTTDNIYNYLIYISDSPVSSVSSSINDSKYIMSSSQWCNKYVTQIVNTNHVTSSDVIANIIGSGYSSLWGSLGTIVYDVFGNSFNSSDLYADVQSDSISFYRMSYSKCPYYAISGLKNQPSHHRNPISEKNHVIAFKDLGLEISKQYYFNIAYIDITNHDIISSDGSYQSLAPFYDNSLLSSYNLYTSIPFSFDNGVFTKNPNDIYNPSDYFNHSNSYNSDGFLNGSDNSVTTNNNTTISDDHRNVYYNYGTIYHGCSNFMNGSSGSSSGSGSSPDLPESDFKDLTDKTGKFFDFIKSIWIASGWLPASLFLTAVTVAIFCRVAGR